MSSWYPGGWSVLGPAFWLLGAACSACGGAPREGTSKTTGAADRAPAAASETGADAGPPRVTVEGRKARIPHQHMIRTPHVKFGYFDLDEGGQVVAYSEAEIDCPGRVRLTGYFFDLQGQAKRPGDDTPYTERQLEVERWECLPD